MTLIVLIIVLMVPIIPIFILQQGQTLLFQQDQLVILRLNTNLTKLQGLIKEFLGKEQDQHKNICSLQQYRQLKKKDLLKKSKKSYQATITIDYKILYFTSISQVFSIYLKKYTINCVDTSIQSIYFCFFSKTFVKNCSLFFLNYEFKSDDFLQNVDLNKNEKIYVQIYFRKMNQQPYHDPYRLNPNPVNTTTSLNQPQIIGSTGTTYTSDMTHPPGKYVQPTATYLPTNLTTHPTNEEHGLMHRKKYKQGEKFSSSSSSSSEQKKRKQQTVVIEPHKQGFIEKIKQKAGNFMHKNDKQKTHQ